jgi:DNA-binding sugar fermentation-stimulating protein
LQNVTTALGCGYIEARTDTTQQSGQTPDKDVEIKNITVYVNGYTETPDFRRR